MKKLTEIEKETIRAFADCDMSIARTADATYYCRQTILYRLKSIHKKTELNPRIFYDLCKLIRLIQ